MIVLITLLLVFLSGCIFFDSPRVCVEDGSCTYDESKFGSCADCQNGSFPEFLIEENIGAYVYSYSSKETHLPSYMGPNVYELNWTVYDASYVGYYDDIIVYIRTDYKSEAIYTNDVNRTINSFLESDESIFDTDRKIHIEESGSTATRVYWASNDKTIYMLVQYETRAGNYLDVVDAYLNKYPSYLE